MTTITREVFYASLAISARVEGVDGVGLAQRDGDVRHREGEIGLEGELFQRRHREQEAVERARILFEEIALRRRRWRRGEREEEWDATTHQLARDDGRAVQRM